MHAVTWLDHRLSDRPAELADLLQLERETGWDADDIIQLRSMAHAELVLEYWVRWAQQEHSRMEKEHNWTTQSSDSNGAAGRHGTRTPSWHKEAKARYAKGRMMHYSQNP